MIQVIDGTVTIIYSWTHPKKGLVWCLASTNVYDVSSLKWGGDKTYAEMLFKLLAKSPIILAATGLRLTRGLICIGDVRLDFQTLDRGRCYTIGFRHPNFHPMAADPPSGISSRLTWRRGSPRLLAFQASPVKQLTIVKISFVWSVVKTSDVVVYGWKSLNSYRGESLTMQRLAGKPVPRPLASREWVFNTSFIYGFILRSRRPEVCPDVLYASLLLHRVRQLIYSRRPPQQVQSARYQYNSLRAFLSPSDRSDFLELFSEFAPCFAMDERFVNNVVDFVTNPAEIKMVGRG